MQKYVRFCLFQLNAWKWRRSLLFLAYGEDKRNFSWIVFELMQVDHNHWWLLIKIQIPHLQSFPDEQKLRGCILSLKNWPSRISALDCVQWIYIVLFFSFQPDFAWYDPENLLENSVAWSYSSHRLKLKLLYPSTIEKRCGTFRWYRQHLSFYHWQRRHFEVGGTYFLLSWGNGIIVGDLKFNPGPDHPFSRLWWSGGNVTERKYNTLAEKPLIWNLYTM